MRLFCMATASGLPINLTPGIEVSCASAPGKLLVVDHVLPLIHACVVRDKQREKIVTFTETLTQMSVQFEESVSCSSLHVGELVEFLEKLINQAVTSASSSTTTSTTTSSSSSSSSSSPSSLSWSSASEIDRLTITSSLKLLRQHLKQKKVDAGKISPATLSKLIALCQLDVFIPPKDPAFFEAGAWIKTFVTEREADARNYL